MTVDGTALGVNDYDLDALRGTLWNTPGGGDPQPFAGDQLDVVVTYTAGTSTALPGDLRLGCYEMLRHLWETQRGPARLPLSAGTDTYVPGMASSLTGRVRQLWDPHVRTLVG